MEIKNNTAVFVCGSKTRKVRVCGNVVRIFSSECVTDELVKLNFDEQELKPDGNDVVIGDYRLRFCNGTFSIYLNEKIVFSEYTGDATIYTENKDFSLAALEGHKSEGEKSEFATQINITLAENDCVYGLGDKAAAIDRRGYEYVQWNTDDPSAHNESYKSLYKSINYVLVSGGSGYYGVFYPDPHRAVFNIGAYKPDLMYIASDGSDDYYIILGKTPAEITEAYTALVGKPLLPRLKMLGNQQSRWSYTPHSAVRDVMTRFAENDLPLDYIHLDIDYMDGYRVYTVDKSRFPDMKALSDELAENGIELVTIIDPAVKYDIEYSVYADLEKLDGYAKRDGKIYHNAVWPGDSVYPDYFNNKTADYITNKTAQFIEENGIGGIWCDMNEPASFNGPLPDDVMFGEYPHSRVHNLYGDYMVRVIAKAFNRNNVRPFVITRACFATSSPNTVAWNGDNQSLWGHLRVSLSQISTMGISGFPFDGVDVGGFGGECNKELLIRWIQANALSPFLRNHSSIHTRSQEPYAFDTATTDIYRRYLRLRYDLIPYLYDLAHVAHQSGVPVMRPMFFNFPNDSACRRISDQVMIGESIMVAPILDQGANMRSVYFPQGEWVDMFNGKTYKGGGAYVVNMTLENSGYFIKSDSILPMYSGLNNLSKKPDTLVLRLNKPAKYINYEDDGRTLDSKRNAYEIDFDGRTLRLKTVERGYDTDYKKLIIVIGKKIIKHDFAYDLTCTID